MRIDWKSKERKEETLQKLAQHIIEKKYIYINENPLTKVLGLHATKGFLHQKQKLKTTEKPSLILTIYVSIVHWDQKNLKHWHERYNLDRRNLATML
jgi:hypothetical protein